jgi:hypothetical protein
VAKPGKVTGAASLAGFTIGSAAGYAPDFVRHSALAAWTLPADVKIQYTGQILSALRRVAAGEPLVALLDQTQTAALPTLPFANDVKPVTQSPELPVALIVVVDSRLPAARAKAFQEGLLKMGHGGDRAASEGTPSGGEGGAALSQLRLQGFVMPLLPNPTGK